MAMLCCLMPPHQSYVNENIIHIPHDTEKLTRVDNSGGTSDIDSVPQHNFSVPYHMGCIYIRTTYILSSRDIE